MDKPNQSRCCVCNQFIPSWDLHLRCVKHWEKDCSRAEPCNICVVWGEDRWTAIDRSFEKKMVRAAKRSASQTVKSKVKIHSLKKDKEGSGRITQGFNIDRDRLSDSFSDGLFFNNNNDVYIPQMEQFRPLNPPTQSRKRGLGRATGRWVWQCCRPFYPV